MYINKVDNIPHKAALPTSKKADFSATINSAKKILGINNGLSLLKIHSASMPRLKHFDSGIGKLNSETAMNFIKLMAFYTGINAVKEFPFGQCAKTFAHYYGPYNKTSITIGEENINLSNITENKNYYGNILTYDDIKCMEDDGKNPYAIYYELELGTDDNYPIRKVLRTAFENYKNGLSTKSFEKDYNNFKKQKLVKNAYTRLALYPLIHKKEPNLFRNINKSPQKQQRFEQYKKEFKEDIEFFKFCQFLAFQEHKDAKEKINSMNISLFGDCLIGFAPQEMWAFPDAFIKNAGIGYGHWGLPALNFEQIFDKKSEAHKLFDDKISFYLKNYDGVRFDVGWCYIMPMITTPKTGTQNINLGRKLIDFIEKRAKEIKGENYNLQNLIYETVGFDNMFTGWESQSPKPISDVRNIVNVLTTEYEHNRQAGWGSPEFYKKTGFSEDEFILGTNNHDGANLRALAEGTRPEYIQQVDDAIPILSKLFRIPKKRLKEKPTAFIKAKLAQLFTVKNQFFYFTDVLGSREDMDSHNGYAGNFRLRLDEDPERQYHTALQQGHGLNLPEALKMVMKSRKLDNAFPEVYSKLSYYAEYLRKTGAKTENEANKNYKGI